MLLTNGESSWPRAGGRLVEQRTLGGEELLSQQAAGTCPSTATGCRGHHHPLWVQWDGGCPAPPGIYSDRCWGGHRLPQGRGSHEEGAPMGKGFPWGWCSFGKRRQHLDLAPLAPEPMLWGCGPPLGHRGEPALSACPMAPGVSVTAHGSLVTAPAGSGSCCLFGECSVKSRYETQTRS